MEGANEKDSNMLFANKGWGVNTKQSPKRKTNSTEKNVPKEQVYKKSNVVVNKLKNNPKKASNFKEDEKRYENNFWIGDQIKNEDEDSDDWMVIK